MICSIPQIRYRTIPQTPDTAHSAAQQPSHSTLYSLTTCALTLSPNTLHSTINIRQLKLSVGEWRCLCFTRQQKQWSSVMDRLSFAAVMEIIRFLGSPPQFNIISCVSRGWAKMLDCSDSEIWCWLASEFKVSLHSLGQKRSLRSTSNYKKVFMKAYKKASQEIKEKHEILLLLARNFFLETARDCPRKLAAIILSVFPDLVHFDVNWTSSVVEANTLVTMCCRGAGRPKCLKLLLETYSAKIELGDMGGFNPLILSAYHGNLSCTVYCVRRGANIFAVGRERSGIHLIAEHWASIRGHTAVRDYLRSIRFRLQKKIFNLSPSKVGPPPLLTGCPSPLLSGCAPPLLTSPTPSDTPMSIHDTKE